LNPRKARIHDGVTVLAFLQGNLGRFLRLESPSDSTRRGSLLRLSSCVNPPQKLGSVVVVGDGTC
jgi:hypothetical protein